jgi:hypothetical protein
MSFQLSVFSFQRGLGSACLSVGRASFLKTNHQGADMKTPRAYLRAALGLCLGLGLAACSGRDDPAPAGPTVVYAAGADAGNKATVWKDGAVLWRMPGGGEYSFSCVNSVCAEGGAVHAAGQHVDLASMEARPFVWSSAGGLSFLGSGMGMASAVCASGGHVYVAGNDGTGGKVWRDGQPLHSLPAYAVPMAIAVSGNDVYTAGHDSSYYGEGGRVWRNAEVLRSVGDASFLAIAVDAGGGVWAAGESDYRPCLMDPAGALSFLGSGEGTASSLHLSGDRLYVAGWDGGSDETGRIWSGRAGGAMTAQYSFGRYANIESVFALGDDVYAGGDTLEGGGVVWKNGEPHIRLGEDYVRSVFAAAQ